MILPPTAFNFVTPQRNTDLEVSSSSHSPISVQQEFMTPLKSAGNGSSRLDMPPLYP